MSYKLVFKKDAEKEWNKLNSTIRSRFSKKLKERLIEPRVESARLHHMKDCYKIKLKQSGYRLVYQVFDDRLVVSVVSIGKRNRSVVYGNAKKRV